MHDLIHTSRRVIYRYRHVGGVLFQVSASAGLASTADRPFSHMMSAYVRPAAKETVEEEEDLDAAGETNAEGGGVGIDHPPGVMDSAISGSGQRRGEESDLCFSGP